MASSITKCIFCARDMDLPQDSSCANICDPCSSAFEDGSYCDKYHKHEDGWRQCASCERQIQCECIMALNSFEVNEASALTCNKCLEKEKLTVSNVGPSSSILNPANRSLLNDPDSPFENLTREEFLTDPWNVMLLNNDSPNQGYAAIEESSKLFQLPNSGHTFLFKKQLTATDCSRIAGRLLLPKAYAEEFLPMLPEQKTMPVVIKDTEGETWNLTLRWWVHNNSRKYVIDGVRGCIRKMGWNAGDILNFYRQHPGGELIMELQKANESTLPLSG